MSRCRCGGITWPSMPSTAVRSTAARPSWTSGSPSTARFSRNPRQHCPLETRGRGHQRRPGRGGRQTLCRTLLPALRPRLRCRRWSNIARRLQHAASTPGLDAPETKARAQAKLATLKVGVGYPDRWRDYRDSRSWQATPSATPSGPSASNTPGTCTSSAAHRPLGVGDDAPDRECREPARHERPQLPSGHPAAALLRSERPHGHGLRRHRRHDRPRDQPQLRRFEDRSFDASGKLNNWWTPEDLDALPGLRRPAGEAVRRLSSRSPACTSMAGRPSARTSPTWPAWPPPTMPTACPFMADQLRWFEGFTGDQQFFLASPRAGGRRPASRAPPADPHGWPCPRRLSTRHGPEPRRLVPGLQRQGGSELYLAPADRVRMW